MDKSGNMSLYGCIMLFHSLTPTHRPLWLHLRCRLLARSTLHRPSLTWVRALSQLQGSHHDQTRRVLGLCRGLCIYIYIFTFQDQFYHFRDAASIDNNTTELQDSFVFDVSGETVADCCNCVVFSRLQWCDFLLDDRGPTTQHGDPVICRQSSR